MACTSCQEAAETKRAARAESAALPMQANDLQVVVRGEIRAFTATDWPADRHKLLIFYPQTFTPVCQSELGAINDWLPKFDELGCTIIAATADPAGAVVDWYTQEPLLADLQCLTFSSYLLPARLGTAEGGRTKRASVFVMADGTIVKQEHFPTVGRSFAELHRMLYGYTTSSYCAEGWLPPVN